MRRIPVIAVLVLVLAATLSGVGVATAVAVPQAPATSPPPAQWAAADAARQARAVGRAVEVTSQTTETGQVFANPDGSFTARENVMPVRVRRPEGWVPVDLTLQAGRDGLVRPIASPTAVVFSAGGSAPLVRLSDRGRQVALAWPDRLPAPVLDGSRATYADVLPGVDLVMTADVLGFSEVLVVHSAAAARNPALAEVRLLPRVANGNLAVDPSGNITVSDAAGAAVFVGSPPRMWDSSGEPVPPAERLAGWATGARQAMMPTRAQSGAIAVTPDRTMLDDPATRFPVYLDPGLHVSGTRSAWTSVWKAYPTRNYLNSSDIARVGHENETGMTNRSFFQMSTSAVRGKHILGATLRTYEVHSWSCSARAVEVWHTGGISSSTTWNNQPTWGSKLATVNVAKGYSSSCPAGGVDFAVTSTVAAAAAANATTTTFGIKATDETDTYAWKKFRNNPTLEITYNTKPNTPTNLSIYPGLPCVTGTSRPVVGTATPQFFAKISDPDNTAVNARFEWWNTGGSKIGEKLTAAAASGVTHSVTIPAGAFLTGHTYSLRVRAEDGIDVSAWTSWCELTVDTTFPVSLPQVSSATYPETVAGSADPILRGGIGISGSFTFTPGAGDTDIVSYKYSLNVQPPATSVAASGTAMSATVTLTPTTDMLNRLFVYSVDRAGNPGPVRGYEFYVRPVTLPTGQWKLDERTGTVAADTSGEAHSATATGAVSWTTGRIGGAAAFNGTNGVLSAGSVLRTDRSFTVSAWVRLNATFAHYTAVSQDGVRNSAFYLRYDGEMNRWAFEMNTTDTDTETLHRALSQQPPGYFVWTNLVGVYDQPAGQMRLYVDGVLQSTVAHTGAWNATGGLQIGRGKWRGFLIDYWNGDIDDVNVYQGVLPANLIAVNARPPASLVANWPMNELSGTVAADATGGGRTATLTAGASWSPDGWLDGALALDGVSGSAASANAVIRTDQSFSIAAWVRLDAKPGSSNPTAVSQDGTQQSGFKLQYQPIADRWAIAVPTSDVSTAGATNVLSVSQPQIGAWTHLTAVYDANAKQLRLYVDGALEGLLTNYTTTWHASGPMQIGRARWGGFLVDWWPGAVDDVRAYQGALIDEDVLFLALTS
jgi:Concanavalin A-like lectin/glucanases superfamily